MLVSTSIGDTPVVAGTEAAADELGPPGAGSAGEGEEVGGVAGAEICHDSHHRQEVSESRRTLKRREK